MVELDEKTYVLVATEKWNLIRWRSKSVTNVRGEESSN